MGEPGFGTRERRMLVMRNFVFGVAVAVGVAVGMLVQ